MSPRFCFQERRHWQFAPKPKSWWDSVWDGRSFFGSATQLSLLLACTAERYLERCAWLIAKAAILGHRRSTVSRSVYRLCVSDAPNSTIPLPAVVRQVWEDQVLHKKPYLLYNNFSLARAPCLYLFSAHRRGELVPFISVHNIAAVCQR